MNRYVPSAILVLIGIGLFVVASLMAPTPVVDAPVQAPMVTPSACAMCATPAP